MSFRSRTAVVTLVALAMLTLAAHAADAPDTPADAAAARAAAERWLSLVDAGRYGESWDEAATYFRGAVPRAQWEGRVRGVRGPLGAVRSRAHTSSEPATSLPGAPDGRYVVIRYATSFEHKQSAVETVTPMREPDGSWRVSGYYVR